MGLVCGLDPGKMGAIVFANQRVFMPYRMPLFEDGSIDFVALVKIFKKHSKIEHVFLERAVAFKMGRTSAFNYGRGFGALEHCVQAYRYPVTYVEPRRWTKLMHQGIKSTLDPKEKSAIAIKRLYPHWVPRVPTNRNGRMHDGIVDAALIAGYGMKVLGI